MALEDSLSLARIDLSPEDLGKLLYVAIRDLNTLDGLWFLTVEERFGTDIATEIDELVWERFAARETQRVRSVFGLTAEGLEGLMGTFRRCPSSAGFGEAQIERPSDRKMVMRITECWPQAARVRKGLGTFNCRGVDTRFFGAMAKTIDPRIEVSCVFCPPEERRDGAWCEWVFELRDGAE